ncbi:hypothetical protein CTheo_9123 [Ceratobasidium theobromae]|uniref:Uncharacterized protein n=1 Tax=Ceratobasidium theobromae TaxID=1582974 RepID=A0A5N5Q682_9AGAM|nr:hypothetical protein CTheo_9123 [Ceratobasidium theobromae]
MRQCDAPTHQHGDTLTPCPTGAAMQRRGDTTHDVPTWQLGDASHQRDALTRRHSDAATHRQLIGNTTTINVHNTSTR